MHIATGRKDPGMLGPNLGRTGFKINLLVDWKVSRFPKGRFSRPTTSSYLLALLSVGMLLRAARLLRDYLHFEASTKFS
jgi:hypothetical protein